MITGNFKGAGRKGDQESKFFKERVTKPEFQEGWSGLIQTTSCGRGLGIFRKNTTNNNKKKTILLLFFRG